MHLDVVIVFFFFSFNSRFREQIVPVWLVWNWKQVFIQCLNVSMVTFKTFTLSSIAFSRIYLMFVALNFGRRRLYALHINQACVGITNNKIHNTWTNCTLHREPMSTNTNAIFSVSLPSNLDDRFCFQSRKSCFCTNTDARTLHTCTQVHGVLFFICKCLREWCWFIWLIHVAHNFHRLPVVEGDRATHRVNEITVRASLQFRFSCFFLHNILRRTKRFTTATVISQRIHMHIERAYIIWSVNTYAVRNRENKIKTSKN